MCVKAEEVALETSAINEDVEKATLLEGVQSMTVIDTSGKERVVDFEVVDAFPKGERTPSGDSIKKKAGCGAAMCAVIIALVVWLSIVLSAPAPNRHFYLAIDEVEWNYVPYGRNNCTGAPFGYPDTKYVDGTPRDRIGSTYTKALFRAYTDGSFTTRPPPDEKWSHLGVLGPALHVEVGDIVAITVRNNARYPFSFSAQGVAASKANEGAVYASSSKAPAWYKFDDALPPLSLGVRDCGTPTSFMAFELPTMSEGRATPGDVSGEAFKQRQTGCSNFEVKPSESRVIYFKVDDAAGPGPNDPSSVMHLYSSHVGRGTVPERPSGFDGFGSDQDAGLLGPLIVTRGGAAGRDGAPEDVDREFVVVMGVHDENDSPYLRKNIWDHIVQPQLGGGRPQGHLTFGPSDKPTVLQALYERAARTGDKLSYAEAQKLVDEAVGAHMRVGEVRGVAVNVWFDKNFFDPRWYDAKNGGTGSAQAVMESLWKESVDLLDPSFVESNAMHGVNGYLYCNQPGLVMRAGERVRWHMASIGSLDSVHTPHWHGNTVLDVGSRADQLNLLAGNTLSVDMVPESPGKWQLHCHVNDHKKGGMLSLYTVRESSSAPPPSPTCEGSSGTRRTYYIAAEPVEWDYYDPAAAAGQEDLCASGAPIASRHQRFLVRALESNGKDRAGVSFTKARYVAYTDATFTTRVAQDASEGLLGPTLRAEVGDVIEVVATNRLPFNVSVHPHGVQYGKGAEGAPYSDGSNAAERLDDSIQPGQSHTYTWCVPPSAGPGPSDPSSVVWLYHDHVHETNGTNAGLVGPIIITAAGKARADGSGRPADVDREQVLLFAALDENSALHAEQNIAARLPDFAGNNASLPASTRQTLTRQLRKYDDHFRDSMRKRSINGKLQCSLPDLSWQAGERVRLHLLSIGDEELHAPLLSGHTFVSSGQRTAAVGLMASTMRTADVSASVPGQYLLRSGSRSGVQRGMAALVSVAAAASPPSPPLAAPGRTYYLAADEVQWDFMPHGSNLCGSSTTADSLHAEPVRKGAGGLQGTPAGFNGWDADPPNGVESEISLYTDPHAAPHRIGTAYISALFREYEDDTFSLLKHGMSSRGNEASLHLGMQGPVLRGKPGDVITVVLHNRLRFPANFVLSAVSPEGGLAEERPLAPGERRTLRFRIGKEHAPTTTDGPDSIAYHYTSDFFSAAAGQASFDGALGATPTPVGEFADYSAGLFGSLIVTRDGSATYSDLQPKDVDREFILFMGVLDQNESPYLDMNIAQFASAPESVDKNHPDFKESNRMHSVNGRVYCNLEGLSIPYGRKARWYTFSLGADDAMASPRWGGHAALVSGSRMATALVQPGQGVVADIDHRNKGTWLLADQTQAHARAGAAALFFVKERVTELCPFAPWSTC